MAQFIKQLASMGFLAFIALGLGLTEPASAETSTLTLDSFSFISFEDEITTTIPSGGSILFEFGTPNPDGSVPFKIVPNGLTLPGIDLPQLNSTLQYALASEANGVMTDTPSGRRIVFLGTVSAQDVDKPDAGSRTYPMSFTTESAAATSADGSTVVAREGFRPPEGANYVQLVGATVAKSDNEKGAAVYMVLSGMFDQLP